MACDSDPIRDVTTAITSDPRAPRRVLYELLDWGGVGSWAAFHTCL